MFYLYLLRHYLIYYPLFKKNKCLLKGSQLWTST